MAEIWCWSNSEPPSLTSLLTAALTLNVSLSPPGGPQLSCMMFQHPCPHPVCSSPENIPVQTPPRVTGPHLCCAHNRSRASGSACADGPSQGQTVPVWGAACSLLWSRVFSSLVGLLINCILYLGRLCVRLPLWPKTITKISSLRALVLARQAALLHVGLRWDED